MLPPGPTNHPPPTARNFLSGLKTTQRTAAWCHTLKHAGGKQLIRVLERLDRKQMPEAVQQEHDRLLNYLRKNAHRMNYPAYLHQGWQIASGAVESACKTVVNQRLCLGGMRWGGSRAATRSRTCGPSTAVTPSSGTPSGPSPPSLLEQI
jgi:hypothetical protein